LIFLADCNFRFAVVGVGAFNEVEDRRKYVFEKFNTTVLGKFDEFLL
jgi:hypothetical protein